MLQEQNVVLEQEEAMEALWEMEEQEEQCVKLHSWFWG